MRLERQRRSHAAHGIVDAAAGVDRSPQPVEAEKIPLSGKHDRLRTIAGGHRTVGVDRRSSAVTRRRSLGDTVEFEIAGVPNDRSHVVGRHLALPVSIKRQLVEFRPRLSPISPEAGNQQIPRIGCDAQTLGLEHIGHQVAEILLAIGVTGDRGGNRRLLKHRTHALVGAQVAGLQDQETGNLSGLKQRLDRGGRHPAPGPGPHDLTAAEHRYRLQLDSKAPGILVEIGLLDR